MRHQFLALSFLTLTGTTQTYSRVSFTSLELNLPSPLHFAPPRQRPLFPRLNLSLPHSPLQTSVFTLNLLRATHLSRTSSVASALLLGINRLIASIITVISDSS